jgi:hypothetical protein
LAFDLWINKIGDLPNEQNFPKFTLPSARKPMQARKPNITPPKQRPLQTTMDALGYDDPLSWAAQTTSGPDTNLAHYPRLMYYYHPDYLGHVGYIE